MREAGSKCTICRGAAGDEELRRVEVWQDELWRLTVSVESEVLGFAYLEPKRHIPSIIELAGTEARTFGEILSRVTRSLREATDSETVYVYIFGTGIPHLHLHLAPHREGDALNSQMIRGEVVAEKLPSGAGRLVSLDYPLLPEEELRRVAEHVHELMAS